MRISMVNLIRSKINTTTIAKLFGVRCVNEKFPKGLNGVFIQEKEYCVLGISRDISCELRHKLVIRAVLRHILRDRICTSKYKAYYDRPNEADGCWV